MAKVKIYDREISYTKVHRKVKYSRLEFSTGGLVLILPQNYKHEKELILKHRSWVYKKAAFIEKSLEKAENLRLNHHANPDEFKEDEFKEKVKAITHLFSQELKVKVNNIFFRRMRTRWGSCSSRGNITINHSLRFLPKRYIEYVLFHEIVHRLHRKHNERFYRIIRKRFKNPEKMDEELFAYWFLLRAGA